MAFFKSFDASPKRSIKVSSTEIGYKILQCDVHKTLVVATVQIPYGATVGKVNKPHMHRIGYTHLTDRCTVLKLEHADKPGRDPCLVGVSINKADVKYTCNVYKYKGMSQPNQSGIRFWSNRDKLFEWKKKDAFMRRTSAPVFVRDDKKSDEKKAASKKSDEKKAASKKVQLQIQQKSQLREMVLTQEKDTNINVVNVKTPKSVAQIVRNAKQHKRLTTVKTKKIEPVEFNGLLDEFFDANKGTRENNL